MPAPHLELKLLQSPARRRAAVIAFRNAAVFFAVTWMSCGLSIAQTVPGAKDPAAERPRAPRAPAAKSTAEPPSVVETPLFGKWEIVDAVPAPWLAAKERAWRTEQARHLLKTQIVFTPREVVTTSKALACKRADYEPTEYSADALFAGALPEPNQEGVARTLGLPRGDVPGVDVMCYSGQTSYHFRDRNTAMFALDDVIYTLARR